MYLIHNHIYFINPLAFSTNSIHFGQEPEKVFGSINMPIHLSSTFAQRSPGVLYNKFDYTRAGNPTVDALEKCLAKLDCAKYGIMFSSGCAAISALISILSYGDVVVVGDDVYGGTNRLLNKIFKKFKLEVIMVDFSDPSWKKAVNEKVKIILIESPTNPTLKIFDIKDICSFARSKNIVSVIDNTFATSYLQSPILLGAHAVLNSCTKYIGGHSDCIGGVITTNCESLNEKIRFNLMSMGGCISPFDAYIFLRSIKTLKIRMIQHCKNAKIISEYLNTHPKVEKVIYPGLESHPQHELAKKQMRDFGGMITIYLKGGIEQTRALLENVKVFTLAESLGGVESLIECPALMTHMSVPPEQRKVLGISDTLIRFSIGIEDVEDLLDDIKNALENVKL